MKKISWITILNLLILFLLSFNFSYAQSESLIFGPKQYEKPKGRPITYTDSFQTSAGSNYKLWVQSGQDGLDEAKNVSVSINGVEVLDSKDLKKNNPSIKNISLQANNIIKVVLKGKEGNFITVKIFGPASNINVNVTSPLSGETILRPNVMVKGTITNTSGNETGVTVNGIVANIYGNQFTVNNIPLVEGTNTITISAKDTANNTAITSVVVNAITGGGHIKLFSNLDLSIAPLQTFFTVSTSKFTPASYSIDFEGDGIIDYTGSTFKNISHIYATEGIYYPILTVSDSQGNTFTDTIAISVLSKTEMDNFFKDKWEAMKQALAQNNINNAISYFDDFSKDAYREMFTTLSSLLSQIVQELNDIQLIRINKNIAEYDLRTIRNGKTYSFPLLFIRDINGLWKIRSF